MFERDFPAEWLPANRAGSQRPGHPGRRLANPGEARPRTSGTRGRRARPPPVQPIVFGGAWERCWTGPPAGAGTRSGGWPKERSASLPARYDLGRAAGSACGEMLALPLGNRPVGVRRPHTDRPSGDALVSNVFATPSRPEALRIQNSGPISARWARGADVVEPMSSAQARGDPRLEDGLTLVR